MAERRALVVPNNIGRVLLQTRIRSYFERRTAHDEEVVSVFVPSRRRCFLKVRRARPIPGLKEVDRLRYDVEEVSTTYDLVPKFIDSIVEG